MNAYIASFMLLLFNAVGLAVPASAAAEERIIPELGSSANLSEAAIGDQSAVVDPAISSFSDHQPGDMAESLLSAPFAADQASRQEQIWAVVSTRSESGDKLEHEEGAP
ncbi:MAG: hypothetical protein ABJF89_16105 [Parasphingorhabdus sp.]|uniref:hypothetical protein n=1 Tax=Parasphingorhabdus sp. TaxID=2709688 RepID=UPI0032670C04